jgi:hypothetical protein
VELPKGVYPGREDPRLPGNPAELDSVSARPYIPPSADFRRRQEQASITPLFANIADELLRTVAEAATSGLHEHLRSSSVGADGCGAAHDVKTPIGIR